VATKRPATAAKTEQVLPLQGAKSFICVSHFILAKASGGGLGKIPFPDIPKVQKGLKPNTPHICGAKLMGQNGPVRTFIIFLYPTWYKINVFSVSFILLEINPGPPARQAHTFSTPNPNVFNFRSLP
jgi:hypothetical protein